MDLVIRHEAHLFKDTVKSCMSVISRLVSRVEPNTSQLEACVESLSLLLQSTDQQVNNLTMFLYKLQIIHSKVCIHVQNMCEWENITQ